MLHKMNAEDGCVLCGLSWPINMVSGKHLSQFQKAL